MHVRVRLPGKPEAIIVFDSKLTKVEEFRKLVEKKFDIEPDLQRLFYGGKVLEDGYTFHDYTIKLNDVVQLMPKVAKMESVNTSDTSTHTKNDDEEKSVVYEDAESCLYRIGEYVDAQDLENGAWFEGKICRIVRDLKAPFKPNEKVNEQANGDRTSPDDKTPNGNANESKHLIMFEDDVASTSKVDEKPTEVAIKTPKMFEDDVASTSKVDEKPTEVAIKTPKMFEDDVASTSKVDEKPTEVAIKTPKMFEDDVASTSKVDEKPTEVAIKMPKMFEDDVASTSKVDEKPTEVAIKTPKMFEDDVASTSKVDEKPTEVAIKTPKMFEDDVTSTSKVDEKPTEVAIKTPKMFEDDVASTSKVDEKPTEVAIKTPKMFEDDVASTSKVDEKPTEVAIKTPKMFEDDVTSTSKVDEKPTEVAIKTPKMFEDDVASTSKVDEKPTEVAIKTPKMFADDVTSTSKVDEKPTEVAIKTPKGGISKRKTDSADEQAKTPKGRKSKTSSAKSPATTPKRALITNYFNKTPKSANKNDTNGTSSTNVLISSGIDSASKNANRIMDDTSDTASMDAVESCTDEGMKNNDDNGILYEVELEDCDEHQFCTPAQIRPRARAEIPTEELKNEMTVLVNFNIDDPRERGFWYDYSISEIKNGRKNTELIGTLYLGQERIPQDGTRVTLLLPAFRIEKVVPLKDRTDEYNKMMMTTMEKRIGPLNCNRCKDDEKSECKYCGCYTCGGKQEPEKIVLCDECDHGYHMTCLNPPLKSITNEDWYCPDCWRSPDDVIAPGGSKKQKKKLNTAKSKRDWGRGMACVGKTQHCSMPSNHFGPIPGVEVGMAWRFRIQLSESGIHRPPVSGIHGRDVEGAYSLVLAGGYEDDVDKGHEFTYTGSGGRNLSGNKRTADQSSDQTLTRQNKALARNCAVSKVCEEGADATEKWQEGRPVRVVRSYKLNKHCPDYAPAEGIRYDGIYKVVKYYPEKGKSGFKVWKYLLRRDDPNPAPWEEDAKKYPIMYPDGYLEAEAEKQALKGIKKPKVAEAVPSQPKKTPNSSKRVLQETNSHDDEDEKAVSPPSKRLWSTMASSCNVNSSASKPTTPKVAKNKKNPKATTSKASPRGENPFAIASNQKAQKQNSVKIIDSAMALSQEELKAIGNDELNKKLWDDCMSVFRENGKKKFISHVTDIFKCIICQDVVAKPTTTICQHNFCATCLKLAFKTAENHACPSCRHDLSKDGLLPNEYLQIALRSIMPGYDSGKK